MKRRRNIKPGIENAKKKLSITRLENLSNELIYEIFDYLDYCSTYETFINLNLRFQSLFINSSSPLKINLLLLSKSNYQHRCKYIITPNISRIISLDISKYFLQLFSIELFTSLESLCLHEIPSEQIDPVLTHLVSLPRFVSLTIHFSTYWQDENSIYRSIFNLPKLKYCKLIFPFSEHRLPLPIATDQCQTLERFVINGLCRLDQLIAILSYTPNLQYLSCEFLDGCGCEEIEVPIVPLNLTHICLRSRTVTFDELKLFLSKVSFRLKYLRIREFYDDNFLHAEQWEQLILDYMPLLSIFDFQYSTSIYNDKHSRQISINRFSSHFWIERNWLFDYQYYKDGNASYLHFFSIVPYRLNDFILHEQMNDDDDIPKSYQNNSINFARHLTIEGHLKVDEYSIRFPQVTKLTLRDINTEETSLCINDINLIFPLIKIKDLHIDDIHFSIDQLIELLSLSSNVESLTLSYKLPLQTETPRLLSIHNKITKVVIDDDECKLEHVQFLLHLFPRLQCLEISIDENELEEIVRFLLSKSNVNHPRDLFSLFFINTSDTTTKKVLRLINREKLIDDYTAEKDRGGLHLWW